MGGRQEVEVSTHDVNKKKSAYEQDQSDQKVQYSSGAKAIDIDLDVEPH
jgi:hypothetical protein